MLFYIFRGESYLRNMLKAIVKAGAVTHLTDARYFAAWEVDYLGFDFSPTGISVVEFNALKEWITGPQLIGEVGLLVDNQLPASIQELQLDGIQLNELVEPEDIATIVNGIASMKSEAKPDVFQEYVIQGYSSADDLEDFLKERKEFISYFILNFNKGGITWQDLIDGQPFDVATLANLSERYPILLEIEGKLPTEIQKELPKLGGFSLRGGAEEKVGYKDFDALGDFFEDLEVL